MYNKIDRSPSPTLPSSGAQIVHTDVGQATPTVQTPTGTLSGLQPRKSFKTACSAGLRAALPVKAAEATAAGHVESFVRLGPSHIAKMTSAREADIYQRFGDALRGVIPSTVPLNQAPHLPDVSPDQANALQRLCDKAQQSGQRVVIMEAVGGNIAKADRRELDIKIGASTASRTELIGAGAELSDALMKKVKMTGADILRGSRSVVGGDRRYSLTGRTQAGRSLDSSRFSAGVFSKSNIREMLAVSAEKTPQVATHLLDQLENIRTTMQKTPVTFVASSILVAIDERNPQNSVAKLIDLAHPVEPQVGPADYDKLNAQFSHGLSNLIALVKQPTPAA
ncbi:inositol polyphosphate kinase family protein [Paraburkholderia aspalathi]|uniref:inositol polyphosphate kinase family protein n=1 Tax=Paraburkholderia aspalathi TaxID=1324617 RepID=UPI0038BBAB74